MSADNFYYITTHPLGGYAVLMGFASYEEEPLVPNNKSRRFESFDEASEYALSEYSEYGVRVDPVLLARIDANPRMHDTPK